MKQEDAGAISRILRSFTIDLAVPDAEMHDNVRSAMARGLPEVKPAGRHDRLMSVAAGGPSLAETWPELEGVTVSVNASLSFLLEKGVKPWACGVFDPRPHMADLVERREDVFYFLGSICHPRLFDKLHGCKIGLWHPRGMPGIDDTVGASRCLIGGGGTMGLRWLDLGYFMGFRKFHAHGLDSSFKNGKTHAYPDHRDAMGALNLFGYETSMNFIEQVDHWFKTKAKFQREGDPPQIKLFGDGLLQFMERQCSTSSPSTTKTTSAAA